MFDKPFTFTAAVTNGNIRPGELESKDKQRRWYHRVLTRRGETVNVRVASSFISPEQAEQNLKELGKDNLEAIAAKGTPGMEQGSGTY